MLRGEQQGKFELSFATPAGCADAVREGRAQVGTIPSIEYQLIDGVEIVSGICIASKERVQSVLLASKLPIEDVATVAVDHSSRASVALLRILMRQINTRQVSFLPYPPSPPAMLARADAALLIGDTALTYDRQAPLVYDLAAEWRKLTGLPFVFALWVGCGDASLARVRAELERSRDYGLSHIDQIAAEYAPRLNMTPESVRAYLSDNIDYSLDQENLQGLSLFYRLSREAGIIPAEKDLRFV